MSVRLGLVSMWLAFSGVVIGVLPGLVVGCGIGGALLGAVSGGGGQALLELGASRARVEVVKLQMSFALDLLDTQAHLAKAQSVVVELDQAYREIQEQLEEERVLNDENAERITILSSSLT